MKRELIMHCIRWSLKDITRNLDKIKECGYTSIQTSVLQGYKNDSSEFWVAYQPLNIAFVESKQMGTKEDLIELCREAHKRDIKVCVDIVLRHVAGMNSGELKPHELVNKRLKDNKWFWTNATNATNHQDRNEITRRACGMPMIEYNNYDYQNICNEFLDELESVGVDFFRLDQLKHFQLKREGSDFLDRVFKHRNNKLTYGEALECSRQLLDEYSQYMNVLSDGSTCSNKSKFVDFVETHDTYYTWGFTKKMKDYMIINEWKHLLQSNKESHMLWFCRPDSNLWASDEIRNINNNCR